MADMQPVGDMRLLDVRGLTKIFGSLTACDHVDLTIAKGEIHALLGENGAGKSTLVKMLFGSLEPHSGEIAWKGEPVRISSPILSGSGFAEMAPSATLIAPAASTPTSTGSPVT